MAQRKIHILGACLLVPFLMTAGVMGVGETQARYADTVVHNTVLYGTPGAVRSDCLLSGTKQIILLGEQPSDQSLTVTFTLESTRDFAERLQWHCSGMAAVDVEMELWMEKGAGILSEDYVLQMAAGSRVEVCMTLTPTEPVTEPTPVNVRVMCGALEGTFRVTLLPVPEIPEEPSEPTEPTEPDDDETVPTEPGEPTDPTEPVEEPGEAVFPMNLEQTPEQEVPEEPAVEGLLIRTFRQIERKDPLPVKLELVGETADRMVLGLDGGGFPEFTRYSPDCGTTWYLLYCGGTIEVSAPETQVGKNVSWSMMLDLSAAGLEGQDQCTLEAWTYQDDTETGSGSAEVELLEAVERVQSGWVLSKPRMDAQNGEVPTEPTDGQGSTEPSEGADPAEPSEGQEPTDPTEGEDPADPSEGQDTTEPTGQAPAEISDEEPFLLPPDPNASFTLPLPVGWEDCDVAFEITYLAVEETGTAYVPVILDPMSLYAQRSVDLGTLTVWVGPNLPAAGKYRLTVTASYEGICFEPLEETFFINYYPQSEMQSGEVTEDD